MDKYKARLVAKGFQQTPGVDFSETFSLVVKASAIRIVFTLAVSRGWDIQQIDINNAFLNGDLDEEVFMSQPDGFVDQAKPTYVCKLHKALYGLKQAPRGWFEKLRVALLTWGFHNSVSDTSLFYSHKHGQMLLLLVYVDDILITGDSQVDVQQVIEALHTQFALKPLGYVHYFLGFEVLRTPLGLHLSQTKYAADLLHRTNMAVAKPCSTPMSLSNNLSLSDNEPFSQPSMYRSTIGALQYLTRTRPDLAFCVNKLSQFIQTPTVAQRNACKRIMRYVKGTLSHGLLFKPASLFNLEGYSNLDWATNIDDTKFVCGICVFLGGNLITWISKKHKVVARSSTEVEYRALSSAATNLMWVQHLLTEIGISVSQPPMLWSDNLGAQALAYNLVYHSRTKHIELDVHFIRNLISEHKLEV